LLTLSPPFAPIVPAVSGQHQRHLDQKLGQLAYLCGKLFTRAQVNLLRTPGRLLLFSFSPFLRVQILSQNPGQTASAVLATHAAAAPV
jgi:hypothetical protein